MDSKTRELVRERAEFRCEYCQLPQAAAPFVTFHVEHIRAKQHAGTDDLSNLALACPDCNAFKGPNLVSFDPETNTPVELYNPRIHAWDEHFLWNGPLVVGRTAIGRATLYLLNMNEDERVEMRAELQARGEL